MVALAAANVLDLARVDRKYLAIEDVSFHRAANDAAADAVRLGGGRVFVAMSPQEGGRLVRDSLGLHLAETADAATDAGVRFILASGSTLRDDATLNERLRKGELTPVGFYSLSAKQGIRTVAQTSAALALLQVRDAPLPAPPAPPAPDRMAQALTLLSVLSTLGVGAWAALGCCRHDCRHQSRHRLA